MLICRSLLKSKCLFVLLFASTTVFPATMMSISTQVHLNTNDDNLRFHELKQILTIDIHDQMRVEFKPLADKNSDIASYTQYYFGIPVIGSYITLIQVDDNPDIKKVEGFYLNELYQDLPTKQVRLSGNDINNIVKKYIKDDQQRHVALSEPKKIIYVDDAQKAKFAYEVHCTIEHATSEQYACFTNNTHYVYIDANSGALIKDPLHLPKLTDMLTS